jgi:hypothetical protein
MTFTPKERSRRMTQNSRITTRRSRFTALGIGAIALTAAALSLGTAVAHADTDPNDPALSELSPDGIVRSEQSAGVSTSDLCVPNAGTLKTSDIRASDMGVPNQLAEEQSPEWVGSRGWQAVAISPADPWGGNFDPQTVKSGPACSPVSASHF